MLRCPQLWGVLPVIGASMLAFGPDSWMEWLSWAASVKSLTIARVVLAGVAVAIAAVMAWAAIGSRRKH